MNVATYTDERQVRDLVAARGGFHKELTAAQIKAVLEICCDPDLAATALVMDPRPAWVGEIVPNWKGMPR